MPGKEAVQVVVRCRPFNSKERNENRGNIIHVDSANQSIRIDNFTRPDQPPKTFTFDATYDEAASQQAFYEESCSPLVDNVLEGYNGTIFAYGQTGCGKTHTMQGPNEPAEHRGVIPRSFDHVFESIQLAQNQEFLVRCSYLEIYNEEIRDLLGKDPKKKCDIKEDPNKGVFVKNLTQTVVDNQETIQRVMDAGLANRTVGQTLMNSVSSRSHSIFTIVIECNEKDEAGEDHFRLGKLNLVDLAGSERQSKTGATGDRLKEGCKINLSLSALGNVISALVDGRGSHIPYRDSKLTRLLQDSLGGNTKTLMVAAISPADYNYDETLSTLRYANRAKNIKNKPVVNEDPKDALLRQYKEEIERLKAQLAQAAGNPAALQALLAPAAAAPEAAQAAAPGGGNAAAIAALGEQSSLGVIEAAPAGAATAPAAAAAALAANPVVMERERIVEKEVVREVPREIIKEVEREVVVEKEVIKEVEVVRKEVEIVEVERVPQAHLDQHNALQDYNRSVIEQRNIIGNRLVETEEALADARNQQDAAASRLAALQAMIVGDDAGLVEDPAKALERQKAEQRAIKRKLRAKKRREAKLEAERKEALKGAAAAEQELKNARAEILDLQEEFEKEREWLLETVRETGRELKLWEQVAGVLLNPTEISRIWEKASFDEETESWTIPKIRPRTGVRSSANQSPLPNLGGGDGGDGLPAQRRRSSRSRGPTPVGTRGSTPVSYAEVIKPLEDLVPQNGAIANSKPPREKREKDKGGGNSLHVGPSDNIDWDGPITAAALGIGLSGDPSLGIESGGRRAEEERAARGPPTPVNYLFSLGDDMGAAPGDLTSTDPLYPKPKKERPRTKGRSRNGKKRRGSHVQRAPAPEAPSSDTTAPDDGSEERVDFKSLFGGMEETEAAQRAQHEEATGKKSKKKRGKSRAGGRKNRNPHSVPENGRVPGILLQAAEVEKPLEGFQVEAGLGKQMSLQDWGFPTHDSMSEGSGDRLRSRQAGDGSAGRGGGSRAGPL